MLNLMQRLAVWLQKFKLLLLCLIPVFGVVFTLNIFAVQPFAGDIYLIPILVGLLWSLFLYSFIGLFQEVPARAPDGAGIRKRISSKIKRALYWLLGLMTLLISVAVVVVTIRLAAVWE